MLNIRTGVTALAFIVATSVAFAQTPATPAKPAPAKPAATKTMAAPPSSTTDDVKKWTKKQWNSAKSEWQKDKAKWNACDTQSKAKHLTGKASWSFFYDCMKA